jgi:hypothetical protein
MIGMTRLALTILDRLMLCRTRNIFMAGQAEPAFKRLKFDSGALNLVTVVTVAASDRRVDYRPQKFRI